jgi:hypothetical protein
MHPTAALRPPLRGWIALRSKLQRASWLAWGVSDQALSSLTNFSLGMLAARSLPPESFGAFSLSFTGYLLAAAVGRGLISQPLTVRFSGTGRERWRQGVADATGAAVAIGLLAGALTTAVGLLAHGPLRVSLLALGITLPGLITQDVWRFAFFAGRRGGSAFLNDLFWGIGQFSILAVALLYLGRLSLVTIFLAWGGGATLAACLGVQQAVVSPNPFRSMVWFRAHKDLGRRYLGENVVYAFEAFLCTYGLGLLAGLAAVSVLRIALMVLHGPLLMAFMGINNAAVPHAVQTLQRSRQALLRFVAAVGAGEALLTLSWGTVVWFTPNRVGQAVLGHSWAAAHQVLLPLTIWLVAGAACGGCRIGLKALGAASLSLRAQVAQTVCTGSLMLAGAALFGVEGAVRGLAASGLLTVGAWWWCMGAGLVRSPGTGRPT